MFRPLHRFLPALDVRTEFGQLGALLVNAVIRFFELGIRARCDRIVLRDL